MACSFTIDLTPPPGAFPAPAQRQIEAAISEPLGCPTQENNLSFYLA